MTGGGRALIYSTSPLSDSTASMSRPNKRYNFAYGSSTAGLSGGPWFLYSLAPTLSISADNQSKIYGTVNPAFTYTVTGLIDGDSTGDAFSGSPALTTAATTASSTGSYVINAGAGTLALSALGYSISGYSAGTLTITPAALTVTANAGQGKVYGAADPALGYAITAGALFGSDSLTGSLNRASGENVGSYAIGQGTLTAGGNYSLSVIGTPFRITPRPLTITALDARRKLTEANRAFAYAVAGLAAGDALADVVSGFRISTAAERNSPFGHYTLQPYGTLNTANYTLRLIAGQLTINGIAPASRDILLKQQREANAPIYLVEGYARDPAQIPPQLELPDTSAPLWTVATAEELQQKQRKPFSPRLTGSFIEWLRSLWRS